jgi:hypothetical protein
MYLDCSQFPDDHTFAEEASRALGVHVNVAAFTERRGQRLFRMVLDAELSQDQLWELISSTVQDKHGTYEFHGIEAILGPAVDQGPRRSPLTNYLRVTYI